MSGYFLFRNQVLVDKYCDPNGLGAGHLHSLGQEGDILVYDGPAWLSAYHWVCNPPDPQAWVSIELTDKEKQMWKALILLYI